MASVVIGLVSGSLGADVDVELSFSDGLAFGRFTRYTNNNSVIIMSSQVAVIIQILES